VPSIASALCNSILDASSLLHLPLTHKHILNWFVIVSSYLSNHNLIVLIAMLLFWSFHQMVYPCPFYKHACCELWIVWRLSAESTNHF